MLPRPPAAPQTSTTSPALDDVGGPAHQHPIRGRGAEEEAPRFFPGQPLGLRQALMRLGARELAVAAVVGLVAPDARALGEHGVLARAHPRIVRAPPAAVDDDLVADLDVPHVLAYRPHDAGAVAAAGVEVLGLSLTLPLGDHVDGRAERGPDIVVVDAGGHDVDQHLVGADGRRLEDLALPRVTGRAEAALSHGVGVHSLRHDAQGRACHRGRRDQPSKPPGGVIGP